MSERVEGERQAATRSLWRHWPLAVGAAFALFVLVILGLAGGPYIFQGVTIESEVAKQLRATTGLAFSTTIPGRFDLLPRPHIVMGPSKIADEKGDFSVECEALEGDVRLLPLIVGRIELVSATFTKPHVTLDLDSPPISPDSLVGQALRATKPLKVDGEQRLGILTLVDGSASIKSKSFPRLPELTGLNVTLDWRDLDSPATLTGSLLADKTTVDLALWVSQPSNLMRGDHSAMAIKVHSAPLDISANGDLVHAATTGFRGHVSMKSPSIAGLFERLALDTELLAPFANFALDSDANVSLDAQNQATIDFTSLSLRTDGNEYEGTLAFQSGARPILSGTLASGQLLLAPFLSQMPAFVDATTHHWSTTQILAKKPQIVDLDLRVSATHLRLSPFVVDDAALAVITRGDRTEVALAGGKAYGGTVRGRFSVGATERGVSVRTTGTLQDVDASTLSWDATGRQLATGTLAGSLSLETSGDSPAAVMRNLHGWTKGTVADGEISGMDIGRALRESPRNGESALSALRAGRTAFSRLAFDAQIADGVATIGDSTMTGSDAMVALGGTADIGTRSLAAFAIATPPAGAPLAAGKTPPQLRFDIGGWLTKPIIRPRLPTR